MTNYKETVRRIGTTLRQYVTGTNPFAGKEPVRIPEKAFDWTLRGSVPCCVDAFVVYIDDDGEIHVLLGNRGQEPHPGWWVEGGKMAPGMSFEDAARYNLQRELKGIVPEIGGKIGYYSMIWDTRAQYPKDAGCHTISFLMEARLTRLQFEELNRKGEDALNGEYTEWGWFSLEDVLDAPEGTYHTTLVDMFADYRSYLARMAG